MAYNQVHEVPNLPGYRPSIPPCMSGQSLARPQTLTYSKGYALDAPLMTAEARAAAAAAALAATDLITARPVAGAGGSGSFDASIGASAASIGATASIGETAATRPTLPKWVENDRKVLRFCGFFEEAVHESPVESARVRRVELRYYLADGTLDVVEPRVPNSGLPQGVLVRRHRAPRDGGAGAFFGPHDLAVGASAPLYGRRYALTDADEFTRAWYRDELGAALTPPLPCPLGSLELRQLEEQQQRAATAGRVEPLAGAAGGGGASMRRFLDCSGQVLRFWAVWDGAGSSTIGGGGGGAPLSGGAAGERRPFVVHLYLEDDTIEVLEVHERNDGRDAFPVFLHRGPLPRAPARDAGVGTSSGRPARGKCYGAGDLRVGDVLNVHGRPFLLYDCDAFTRAWYKANLGYPDELLAPLSVDAPPPPARRPALPPHNGYGSLEDSLQNCVALVPKPPRKDMHKLMNKDKIVLRFAAQFAALRSAAAGGGAGGGAALSAPDQARRFVLSYFCMDDTMLIFEPPQRNSGRGGGKFLERQPVYRPGVCGNGGGTGAEPYTHADLFVGAVITVFGRGFELTGADEFTLTYMENNRHTYVVADAGAALRGLRAQAVGREAEVRVVFGAAEAAGAEDGGAGAALSHEGLEAALAAAGLRCSRHSAIALHRTLARNAAGGASGRREVTAGAVLAALLGGSQS